MTLSLEQQPDLDSLERLLLQAQAAGLLLRSEGDRLKVRGPKGAEGLARQLIARKAEVLPLLDPAPDWDQPRADAALAEVEALLDGALARNWLVNTDARRRIVEVYRLVVRGYYTRRDPYLFGVEADIRSGLLARWRCGGQEV